MSKVICVDANFAVFLVQAALRNFTIYCFMGRMASEKC